MRIALIPTGEGEATWIDTGSAKVEIFEAFEGPLLWTASEGLGICMRDNGFEVSYVASNSRPDETQWVTFNNGDIKIHDAEPASSLDGGMPVPHGQPHLIPDQQF
jgi:hypothetical protein